MWSCAQLIVNVEFSEIISARTKIKAFCSKISSSDDLLGRETEPKKPSLVTQQYQTLGETLTICEIATWRTGIPFLPPNKRRRSLLKKYEGPLDEFVRISLVCVSTKTLDSYCEDLDTIDPAQESGQLLFIDQVSLFERFFVCAIVLATLFFLSLCVCTLLGISIVGAAVLALLAAIPASLLAMFSCMEIQRRASFYALLTREIMRRRGQDDPNSSGVLISVKT